MTSVIDTSPADIPPSSPIPPIDVHSTFPDQFTSPFSLSVDELAIDLTAPHELLSSITSPPVTPGNLTTHHPSVIHYQSAPGFAPDKVVNSPNLDFNDSDDACDLVIDEEA